MIIIIKLCFKQAAHNQQHMLYHSIPFNSDALQ